MEYTRFRVNAPDVMHETIDGEVIAIHLVSGNYYSLRGSSAEIWAVVSDSGPISADEIVDTLAPRFTSSRSEIEASVERFLVELRDEGLVAGTEAPDERGRVILTSVDEGAPRTVFAPPQLERYTDMQDLVLLDPVHQVDDTGWPRARADASAESASAR